MGFTLICSWEDGLVWGSLDLIFDHTLSREVSMVCWLPEFFVATTFRDKFEHILD